MENVILFIIAIGILVIWAAIWKGLGLWYSAGNKDKKWFVAMFIFNTAGILPIIYLWFKTDFFKRFTR